MAIVPSFEEEQYGNSAVDFTEQYLHKKHKKAKQQLLGKMHIHLNFLTMYLLFETKNSSASDS
jgi:hypothetical protein